MDGQVLGWDHGACVVDWVDGRGGEAVANRGVWVRSGVLLDMEPDREHLAHEFGYVVDGAHMLGGVDGEGGVGDACSL